MVDKSTHLVHPSREQHPDPSRVYVGGAPLLVKLLAALTRRIPWLEGPLRYLPLGLAVLIILVGAGLVWSQRGFARLTRDERVYQVDHLLSLQLLGDRSARFRIETSGLADSSSAMQEALPSYLEPMSLVYDIRVRGGDIQLVLGGIPDDAVAPPDLFAWDQSSGTWVFVPTTFDPSSGAIFAGVPDGPIAFFQLSGVAPLIGTQLEQGHTLGNEKLFNVILISGFEGQPDGTLEFEQPPTAVSSTSRAAILPVISVPDWDAQNAIFERRDVREVHLQSIVTLIDEHDFSGIVLDYGELSPGQSEAFHKLVEVLNEQMEDRLLAVRMPTPEPHILGWKTQGYDWRRIGQAADLLIVHPPGNPASYQPGGEVDRFLAWAAGQTNRLKLVLAFSTLSVDEWGLTRNPIPYEYALAPLGGVSLEPDASEQPVGPVPGQPLTFHLSGDAVQLIPPGGTIPLHYDVYTEGGLHTIWVMNGEALRQRLDWFAPYRWGGVILEDFAAEGNSPEIPQAVQQFMISQPSTLNPALQIQWTVRTASGAVAAEAVTELGTPLAWTPANEGEYIVQARVAGETSADRAAAAIIVGGQNTGIVPSQEAVVIIPEGASPPPSELPTLVGAAIPEGMPLPAVPPGAAGRFELGGQVNHVINDPARMKRAGMTWVKFQLAWAEDMDPQIAWDLIQQGRKNGLKVLLSIPGQVKYPTSINIAAYLDFLRGVAYYGPDAIEVWNEANLDFEWPRGRIDGAHYTREMLAPAYNAIKQVNPNIMVISGALAPTGAFYNDGGCSALGTGCDDWLYLQQMAQSGAANYMDCVGAHFNAGATSPHAATGHPADPGYQHYSWYFGGMLQLYGGTFGRPVCFTELGYLSGEGLGDVPQRFNWAKDTSVAEQATWLAETAQLGSQSGLVRLMIVWNFDFTYWGEDPMAGYAMVRPDGSCPACDALDSVMP